ncbi:hypothetical protein D3C85_462050 [compost metagenome]
MRQKIRTSSTAMTSMADIAIQKPSALCTSGMNSKFMPKMPAMRLSGRKMAVSTVSTRMMSLARWPWTLKCICTAVSAFCSSRCTWCTTRWMCSSTSRLRTMIRSRSRCAVSPCGTGRVSSESIQSCMAARWSSQISSSRCSDWRASISALQLVKRLRGSMSSVCQWSSCFVSSRRMSR